MYQLYFFKNIINYTELIRKTQLAYARNSMNLRYVSIEKHIYIEEGQFENMASDLRKTNNIILQNISLMKIEKGIWMSIELDTKGKSIIVMSDGYPYPRFVAVDLKE